MSLRFLILSLLLITVSFADYGFSTCARMDDGGLLEKVARGQCITSCSVQNCGTGYCERRGGRPTCVCSRCKEGGNVPIDALIKKGK